ncbi:DUF4837 family protein [Yeosuana sp.]|uniref:DUF4837 family protein n=1 Tax=Yeosuana sp. TaxID=2529388 RepID=UPI004054ABDE|tara:strand:- start:8722 stop:9699 length:978 start_codon:yes stop_codon:yes gene_type:complete
MRKLFLITLLSAFIFSCGDSHSKNEKILFDSSGNINNVSVVVDNDMWDGDVGEAIRNTLAATVDGLPQDEPMFSMKQIPPSVFSGFVAKNRTVLKIEVQNKVSFQVLDNIYAKPQRVVVISGPTQETIVKEITSNASKIIVAFKDEELTEKQRRINLSLHNDKKIEDKLGVSIKFPTAYRVAKVDNSFFWIRKDIKHGSMNLMLYDLPYNAIKRSDSVVNTIIKIRDSIGEKYIPGPTDGSYMITENAYTPFHFETILDNKPTLETKGIWDVKNAFMAGPFINYSIEDVKNNRWVVVEGFVFAPSVDKRDYMFELEAIIRSIKIK